MTDGGWIPAWRKLFAADHWLAPNKIHPAGRREAWLDLCQMATHRPRKVRGEAIGRGELLVSVRTLADRWGWSKSRTSRFIVELESSTAIGTVRETRIGTVYRVVNYETYAVMNPQQRDSERDSERDRRGTDVGQEQEQKHLTKQLSLGASVVGRDLPQTPSKGADGNYRYPDVFERAWSEYPQRDGSNPKLGAYAAFRSRISGGADPEQLVIAAKHYRLECQRLEREGTEFVLQVATFYGRKGHWEEYLKPPKLGGNGKRTRRIWENELPDPT